MIIVIKSTMSKSRRDRTTCRDRREQTSLLKWLAPELEYFDTVEPNVIS